MTSTAARWDELESLSGECRILWATLEREMGDVAWREVPAADATREEVITPAYLAELRHSPGALSGATVAIPAALADQNRLAGLLAALRGRRAELAHLVETLCDPDASPLDSDEGSSSLASGVQTTERPEPAECHRQSSSPPPGRPSASSAAA